MLEPGLQRGADGLAISEGSCLHAAVLAAWLWNRFHGGGARLRGGDGDLEMGALDANGSWCGHYWVEVFLEEGRFVVDITADQFGHPPVRVLVHSDVAGRQYRAGRQDLVDGAVLDLAESLGMEAGAMLDAAPHAPLQTEPRGF